MSKTSLKNIQKLKKKARRTIPREPVSRIQGNTPAVRKRLKKLAGKARNLGRSDDVVTYRYEFYEYVGLYDDQSEPPTHEALCEMPGPDGVHGIGRRVHTDDRIPAPVAQPFQRTRQDAAKIVGRVVRLHPHTEHPSPAERVAAAAHHPHLRRRTHQILVPH